MPKRIFADPEGGFKGTTEENGTRVQGMYRYVAYVYGPGELPHAYAETMAQLRTKYWDPARRALVIPGLRGGNFTFGPRLLSETTDTTMVKLQQEFWIPTQDNPKAAGQ